MKKNCRNCGYMERYKGIAYCNAYEGSDESGVETYAYECPYTFEYKCKRKYWKPRNLFRMIYEIVNLIIARIRQ